MSSPLNMQRFFRNSVAASNWHNSVVALSRGSPSPSSSSHSTPQISAAAPSKPAPSVSSSSPWSLLVGSSSSVVRTPVADEENPTHPAPAVLSLLDSASSVSSSVAGTQFELCAVPKRQTSKYKQRIRREGQARQKKTYDPIRYKQCLNCGRPVRPHFLCPKCKKVHPQV